MFILVLSSPFMAWAQLNSNEVQDLKVFESDYCSKWPDGTKEDPTQWAHCCFTHDLHYWIGGTEDERQEADTGLKKCVKLSGSSIESFLIYMGVRIGGKPGDASYSWGFGWTKGREYEKIPTNDLLTAKSLLETSQYNQDETTKPLIAAFINEVLNPKLENE
jgi:hypothetical protein